MSLYLELFLDQGATFSKTLPPLQKDLSGIVVRSQLKTSYYSTKNLVDFVTSIVDPLTGTINLYLDSDTTSKLKPRKYVFDVILEYSNGTVEKVYYGLIYITPRITT